MHFFGSRPLQDALVVLLAAAAIFLYGHLFFPERSSADFLALWLAGESLALGRPESVYPAVNGIFAMRPPAEWVERLAGRGYRGEVFPYLYPPIWAWLAEKLGRVTDYRTLVAAVTAVNPALMAATVALARRFAAPAMPLALYMPLALIALLLSVTGMLALHQNQPQILVALLIVLAIERSEHGSERAAGLALALATAIKLYPALFALLLLARGQKRAFLWFLGAGLLLAGLSVAAAGWPLHAEFLKVLAAVSRTATVTIWSNSLESFVAQLLLADQQQFIAETSLAAPRGEAAGWRVVAKPVALLWLQRGALIAALVGAAWALRIARSREERAALWPAAVIFLAVTGPLAWPYYYIPAVACVPLLVERMNPARGFALLAAFAAATSSAARQVLEETVSPFAAQSTATAALVLLGLLFVLLRRQRA
jgi:hypothetical protein